MKTETFTQDRSEALAQILRLLDLDGEPLSIRVQWALLNHLHSVPYANRKDGSLLADHLDLVLLGIKAVDRSETRETFAASPALQALLRTISTKANEMAGT